MYDFLEDETESTEYDKEYICTESKKCVYKGINNICDYLMSNLPEYYIFHCGEEKETTCENPFKSATRI